MQTGGGGAPLILALGRERQIDLYEFKAILISKSRTVTQRNPVSKKISNAYFCTME